MRKRTSPSQRTINNIRKRLRQDMERLALTHKGCEQARGCGCIVDRSLTVLANAERVLFDYEIDSYADPETPRRIVNADNSISTLGDGEMDEEIP